MLNFIDLKKLLLSNFKKLNIDVNDLIVLFAIYDLKENKKTPLPGDVVEFLGLDKEIINKSYTDLLKSGYIEVQANELSLEGTFTNIKNLDLVSSDPSKLIDQATIFFESKLGAKLTASQQQFVKTALAKYGMTEFKRVIGDPKCKGSADDMIAFFINSLVPKATSKKVSRTKWVSN